MPVYTLYAVPHVGARTDGRRIICADDPASLALAQEMVASYVSIEVWRDARLIGQVHGPAQSGQSQAPEASNAA